MVALAPIRPLAPSCPSRASSAPGAASGSGPSVAVASDGEAARHALSVRERERCARFPTAGARRDFRAGRLAAHRAVVALARRGARVGGASVSIAHRRGRGLAAAAGPGAWVGVDLEREGAVGRAERRYFASARELSACPGNDPTVLWTLKEAAWKLLRLPRSEAFHALEVVADPRGDVVWIRHGGWGFPARYRIVHPWPAWTGAVVWRNGEEA